MKNKIVLLSLLSLLFINCNSKKKDKENDTSDMNIENTKWIISTLDNDDVNDEEKTSTTIHFILETETNKVTGFSGCNSFMGSYKIDGNKISFSQITSTRMMCSNTTVNEMDVLNVFNSADNFRVINGELALNNSSETTLAEFKKAENFENQIVEKYWKLKKLNGQEVKMLENQEKEIFFILKTQNNRITGFAGCNNIIGEYVLEDGNKIKFKNVATTLKMCPELNLNESELLDVLSTASNYTLKDDVLSLYIDKNTLLAVFESVYLK